MPRVLDDLVVAAWQEEVAYVGEPLELAVGVGDQAAEHDPAAVVGAGGVLPFTGEQEAAVHLLAAALRCVRRSDPRVRVGAVDLVLQPGVGQRDLPRVHADDAGDPARGRVVASDRPHPFEEDERIGLVATVAGGLQQADAARLAQHLRGLVGQPAGIVAERMLGAQEVGGFVDAGDGLVHRWFPFVIVDRNVSNGVIIPVT